MRRIAALGLLALTIVVAPATALAQTSGGGSTGVLTGRVQDQSGGVLPGVTVTTTSPAMMGDRSTVTDGEGQYRFLGVPAGEYAVTYALEGFDTLIRKGILITVGFTANVDVEMRLQSLETSVTVSGQSPVIDSAATRVQTSYTQEMLSAIPNSRDLWGLLASTPSVVLNRVDVGGNTAGSQGTYFAYGYSGQNRPLVEGINVTEGTGGAGLFLDYGQLQEVFISPAANSAEMPVPGVLSQFISKSGGNRFAGSAYLDFETDKLQSTNLTSEQIRPRGPGGPPAFLNEDSNRLLGYYNVNVDFGGPIVFDKLWFFGAYMQQQNKTAQPPIGQILDGTVFRTRLTNYTGKVTYNPSPNDKLIGYVQQGTKWQPNRTEGAVVSSALHRTKDSTLEQKSPALVYKVDYQRTFGSSGFLEARLGRFGYNFSLRNHTQTTPRYEDITTNEVSGGGRDWELRRRRRQVTATYAHYLDNLLGGDHNVKAGIEYQRETGNWQWYQGYTDSVLHLLRAGVPSQVRLYTTPSSTWNGLANVSLFVTDSWTISRLTANLGLRFDRYRVFLPEQKHPVGRFFPADVTYPAQDKVVVFSEIVPRLGLSYDLMGDGRTVLKVNWGQFVFYPGMPLADSVNPNPADQFYLYNWGDTNGNRIYDLGEETTLVSRNGGVQNAFIDENLKDAYTREFSAWLEREIVNDLAVKVGYVWKKDYNGYQQMNVLRPYDAFNVPVTVVDPGVDGVVGTADDGVINAFNLDSTTRGTRNVTTNVDGYEGTYETLEFTLAKRWSKRWSMTASFSTHWTREFGALYYGQRVGTSAQQFSFFGSYPNNPNDRTNNTFTNWDFKLFGTFEPAWGLRVTPMLKSQSGAPFGRVVNAALNYNSAQPILVEPLGTQRQETVTLVDVRIEKRIPITQRLRAGLFFDVFNALNANTVVNLNWVTGPRYLYPITVVPPRIVKLGLKLDF